MKNTKKTANKLPVPGKVRKGFRFYCAAVLSVALVLGCSVTAFAACISKPLTAGSAHSVRSVCSNCKEIPPFSTATLHN